MSSSAVRRLWAQKLAGKLPAAREAEPLSARRGGGFEGIVLGIDPSLRGTGLALVEFRRGGVAVLLHSRTVKIPARVPFAQALGHIAIHVDQVLGLADVMHVAVEQTIYVQNFQTAQILGAARGAALSRPGSRDLPVFEYAPLRIKQAVVGRGRASKQQVTHMVMAHLSLGRALAFDEADAAGAALCHAFTWRG